MSASIVYIDEVPSTNEYLQELIRQEKDLCDGLTVCARSQTRGKGQIGNSWVSEPGQNLTFSVLFHPIFLVPQYQFCLSQAVSLAVYDTLVSLVSPMEAVHFSIKWPNDIYYKDRKLGGILIENQIQAKHISHSIIGIGLNINQKSFPEALPNPISLTMITGETYHLEKVLDKMQAQLLERYRELYEQGATAIQLAYHQHLYRYRQIHEFSDGKDTFEASILHVEDDGKLVLQLADGTIRKFYFKEIYFTDLRN